MSFRKVLILDSTLREGEQTPGVSFTVEQKLEIARKLDEAGIHMIEAGHPSVSPDVKRAVKLIAKEGLNAEIIAHSRAVKSDIDVAVECDVDRIAIFYGVSDIHLEYKHKISREDALRIIAEHIEYARSYGVKVRFTAEDASRASIDYLIEVVKTARDAGADRVSIADTVGILTPFKTYNLVRTVLEKVPNIELDIHAHNDLGMAVANSLAAFEAGVTAIHATINGLGERAGITSLQEIAIALKVHYGIDVIDLKKLPELSRIVEKYSGIIMPPHTPVTGENVFIHKAGIHVAGILANPQTYEPYPPEWIGRSRDWTIDKYTGKAAVRARLEKLGISLSDDELMKVVMKIKELGARILRDADLLEIVEEVTGRQVSLKPPEKLQAMIWIKCESNVYTTNIARRVINIDGVMEVIEITGDYDILAKVEVKDHAMLNQVIETIRSIKGVLSTHTQIVLKRLPR